MKYYSSVLSAEEWILGEFAIKLPARTIVTHRVAGFCREEFGDGCFADIDWNNGPMPRYFIKNPDARWAITGNGDLHFRAEVDAICAKLAG